MRMARIFTRTRRVANAIIRVEKEEKISRSSYRFVEVREGKFSYRRKRDNGEKNLRARDVKICRIDGAIRPVGGLMWSEKCARDSPRSHVYAGGVLWISQILVWSRTSRDGDLWRIFYVIGWCKMARRRYVKRFIFTLA